MRIGNVDSAKETGIRFDLPDDFLRFLCSYANVLDIRTFFLDVLFLNIRSVIWLQARKTMLKNSLTCDLSGVFFLDWRTFASSFVLFLFLSSRATPHVFADILSGACRLLRSPTSTCCTSLSCTFLKLKKSPIGASRTSAKRWGMEVFIGLFRPFCLNTWSKFGAWKGEEDKTVQEARSWRPFEGCKNC